MIIPRDGQVPHHPIQDPDIKRTLRCVKGADMEKSSWKAMGSVCHAAPISGAAFFDGGERNGKSCCGDEHHRCGDVYSAEIDYVTNVAVDNVVELCSCGLIQICVLDAVYIVIG